MRSSRPVFPWRRAPVARRGALVALMALALVDSSGCATSSRAAAGPPPPSSPSPLLGRPAPALRRPTVQGGRVDPGTLAGRVVVVEFFARYCRPCQKRLPAAEALRRELPDVAVVGVSLDDAPDVALAQVARYGLRFPVIHDQGNVIAGRFRVAELPVAFVLGRDGRVAWVSGPEQNDDALRLAVLAARTGRRE